MTGIAALRITLGTCYKVALNELMWQCACESLQHRDGEPEPDGLLSC